MRTTRKQLASKPRRGRPPKPGKNVTVRLPLSALAEIEQRAAAEGLTPSQVTLRLAMFAALILPEIPSPYWEAWWDDVRGLGQVSAATMDLVRARAKRDEVLVEEVVENALRGYLR